ncbi:MAG: methyl-accepting chemotaxis protein [Ignavibacteria bacterium]|jgi:methyl-accepting chemotaxis protein
MKTFFYNLSIKKKILGGFFVVLLLLVIVASIGYSTISSSTDGFMEYRKSAINSNSSAQIQSTLLTARIEVINFLRNGDQKYVSNFQEDIKEMEQYVKEAYESLENEEYKKIMTEVEEAVEDYKTGFVQVVEFMNRRDQVVKEVLDKTGVQVVNEQLSPLMEGGSISVAKATKHMLLIRLYVMKFLDNNGLDYVERVNDEFKLLDRYLVSLPSSIRDNIEKYRDGFNEVVNIIEDRNKIVNGTLDNIGPRIATELNDLNTGIKARQEVLGPELQSANLRGNTIVITMSLIAVALGLMFSFIISNAVTNPVFKANHMMQELGKGRLGTRLKLESKDEIGEMADAMDNYADTLQEIVEAMDNIADGNLNVKVNRLDEKDEITPALDKIVSSLSDLKYETEEMTTEALKGNLKNRGNAEKFKGGYKEIVEGFNNTLNAFVEPIQESSDVLSTMSTGDLRARMQGQYEGDFALIKNSVNDLGNSLSNLIGQVSEAVQATASASSEISSSSEEMAAGAQEQSAQTGEVAASVEEMTKTIMQSADSANRAANLSKKSGEQANLGNEKVNKNKESIEKIISSSGNTAQIITALAGKTDQIGEIAQVIDDIADQTNLLALNAAIEAARAGEQGRGFAVVADEVRKLAERTTKATKEIAETIKAIQKEAKEADDSMIEAKESVMEGKKMTDEVEETLNSILQSAKEVDIEISQLAAASEEQSAAAEQISKNVESISSVSQQSAAGTQQIARAAEDLNQLTENLQGLVLQFKIDTNGENSYQLESSFHAKKNKKLLVS